MAETSEVRNLFLLEFIRHILTGIPEKASVQPQFVQLPQDPMLVPSQFPLGSEEEPIKAPAQIVLEKQAPQKIVAIKEIHSEERPRAIIKIPEKVEPKKEITEATWGKIKALLEDKTVESIECNGPDQKISINRNKALSSTEISLTSEEINKILQEVSKENNTPIEDNILKIDGPQMIITGIISEFGGSRFVIHKK